MRTTAALPAALAVLLLAACAGPAPDEGTEPDSHETELDAPQPRLAVLHDDGILVLDAASLDEVADLEVDGVTRVAEAGDGRHVMLTTATGFGVLDGGVWTDSHGDHGHSYAAPPEVIALTFLMDHPGHVVAHHGSTALFSDGEGTVTFFDPDDLADGNPATRVLDLAAPHHGVALELSDGVVVVTAGDDDERRSVVALRPDGSEVDRTDGCPDVHGETVAADEALLFGCTGSVVVYDGGEFREIALPDATAGVGGPKGHEDSSVVLADYAAPDEAEPNRVALVDLDSDGIRLVDLPAAYYYWSLARGDDGAGIVLTTDGALQIVDAESGEITASIPVIEPWRAPDDWREPAPSVTVLDDIAYVIDPAGNAIHAVDLATGAVIETADLGDVTPHSLALVRG